ncbi:MAG: hypothetical protein RLZZ241_99 [Bacteroidota bacterium]
MHTKFLIVLGFVSITAMAQEVAVTSGLQNMLAYSQGNIQSLCETFTQEQLDWRPAPGIRSAGEVMMHAASTNYYVALKLGFPTPEEVDPMNMESIRDKAAILEALKNSAAFLSETIAQTDSDSFGEEVDLGFMRQTRIGALLLLLEHNAEHKGQLIAYARSNGVVPPWSN